jgi:bacteriocin-like protein
MSNVILKSADAGLQGAGPDATRNPVARLSDDELSTVSGGRVKTSDRQQKAVLDFIKG